MLREVEEDANRKILRTASYTRRHLDSAVIRIDPDEHEEVRDSISGMFDRANISSTSKSPIIVTLGRLDILPLEVLQEILGLLDIRALFRFRQLNSYARHLISTMVQCYKEVATHARDALCAVLRTDIALHFTFHDLYDVLCTENCAECGLFGGFVFLLSLTRCCFPCLSNWQTVSRFSAITPQEARKYLFPGLSLRTIRKSVPALRTIPGNYSRHQTPRYKEMLLIGAEQLIDRFDFPDVDDGSNSDSGQEVRSAAYLDKVAPIFRYTVTAPLPYLDEGDSRVHLGVCCKKCQTGDRQKNFGDINELDRVYMDEDLIKHFKRRHATPA